MTIQDVKDITSFKWATVTAVAPLAIKLDGDTAALALVPESLIDPQALTVGDRVRVELSLRKCVIHGRSSGLSAFTGGGKNKIINGNFRTNQRSFLTGSSLAPLGFGFDRWRSAMSVFANQVNNPSNENAVLGTGFIASSCTIDPNDLSWAAYGTHSINLYSPTAQDSFAIVEADAGGIRLGMTPGKTYVLSATGNMKVASTTADTAPELDYTTGTNRSRTRAIVVHILDSAGTYHQVHSLQVPNVINTPTRVSCEFTIPAGATGAFVRLYLGTTSGQIRWDAVRLVEKNTTPSTVAVLETDYIDGSMAGAAWQVPNANWTYWGGPITFVADPFHGQSITLPLNQQILQVVERANIEAGPYTLSWLGTAKARVYNVGSAVPAFTSGPITKTLDGLADVVVEFQGVGTLSKVQLEAGVAKSAYELLQIQQELALCQRYYIRYVATIGFERMSSMGFQGTTTSFECYQAVPVPMRAVPTISSSGLGWSDNTTFNVALSTLTISTNGVPANQNVIPISGTFPANGAAHWPGTLVAYPGGAGTWWDLSAEL